MGRLPVLPNGDRIRKAQTVNFGGLNHNKSAQDGAIYDMWDMTSDEYPLLSSRDPRHTVRTVAKPNGLYANDGIYYVEGTRLKRMEDGSDTEIGTLSDSEKTFAVMGAYLIIFPDKKYYNRETGEYGNLEARYSGSFTITNGTYAGEDAKANTIQLPSGADASSIFREGDSVTLVNADETYVPNKTLVIREIDGNKLVFYENSFILPDNKQVQMESDIVREVPELDFICTNENRLWGCKGDRIYASKLGDPFNWNVFDGISTDSWQVDVGSAGDFTACYSYRGYPCFFKEDYIYKVYGAKPSNFQVMASASLGVKEGAGKSLAVAGEVLFYLSRAGVMAYSGGIPQNISEPLGDVELTDTVGGSDGRKYYLAATSKEGMKTTWCAYVYDTKINQWYVETMTGLVGMTWQNGLYFMEKSGNVKVIKGNAIPAPYTKENGINSVVEFGDFVEGEPNKKGTSKLQIRVELEDGASLKIEMMFDSDGVWREVKTLSATKKRSFYLPIIPRRSDHFRIKLTGRGKWILYSLVRESYFGSEL